MYIRTRSWFSSLFFLSLSFFFGKKRGRCRPRKIWKVRDKIAVTTLRYTEARSTGRRAPSKSVPDCIIERE